MIKETVYVRDREGDREIEMYNYSQHVAINIISDFAKPESSIN